METNTDAIESLRTFVLTTSAASAVDHAHLVEFAHLCTAALNGEEWATERLTPALSSSFVTGERSHARACELLNVIRATDATRPDGAIARSFQV